MTDYDDPRFSPILEILNTRGWYGYWWTSGGDGQSDGKPGSHFSAGLHVCHFDDYTGEEQLPDEVPIHARLEASVDIPVYMDYPNDIPERDTPEFDAYIKDLEGHRLFYEAQAFEALTQQIFEWCDGSEARALKHEAGLSDESRRMLREGIESARQGRISPLNLHEMFPVLPGWDYDGQEMSYTRKSGHLELSVRSVEIDRGVWAWEARVYDPDHNEEDTGHYELYGDEEDFTDVALHRAAGWAEGVATVWPPELS